MPNDEQCSEDPAGWPGYLALISCELHAALRQLEQIEANPEYIEAVGRRTPPGATG